MVRVISVDGENVTLRVVSDCMVDDIELHLESLKRPIPYGMGYYILPQSICGVTIEDDNVAVESLPTVEDAVKWCKEHYLRVHDTKIEICIMSEDGVESSDNVDAKEMAKIILSKVETNSKLFVVPPCVTHLDVGSLVGTHVETVKIYGDTLLVLCDYFSKTNVSKILLPEVSLYDLSEFDYGVTVEYFSEEA